MIVDGVEIGLDEENKLHRAFIEGYRACLDGKSCTFGWIDFRDSLAKRATSIPASVTGAANE